MRNRRAGVRPWLALAGAAALVAVLLPPVTGYARQYELAQALQFAVFATGGPALVVVGAPWRRLGLGRAAAHLTRARSHRPRPARAAGWLLAYVTLVIGWRLPAAVGALARHQGLAAAELISLGIAAGGIWLEIAESPPLLPVISRPLRAGVAAVAMWTIWVMAYLMGMSGTAWSAAYRHPAAGTLSAAADQQLAAGVLWAMPALCFVPAIYGSLMTWLRDSEDPDEALRRAAAGIAGPGAAGPSAPGGDGAARPAWPRPPRGWKAPPA